MTKLLRAGFSLWIVTLASSFDSILLVRHCARSMYPTLRRRGDPNFDNANNYTAQPFPSESLWSAEGEGTCTSRGKDIARTFGKSLRAQGLLGGNPEAPVIVVADNISRCIVSAEEIVKGLNVASPSNVATYNGITRSLDPSGWAGLCAPEDAKDRTMTMQAMIREVASGGHYLSDAWSTRRQVQAELQDLVGAGAAPSISTIPDHINENGIYVGGLFVSSQGMIENFILEAGAGIPVAWGRLDNQTGRQYLWERLSPLNVLYNRINHNGEAPATRDGAVIVGILRELNNSTPGSLVLVGHDTNVDNVAALLDLTWSCGPFADNESPPQVGLLFEMHGNNVRIKVVCTALDHSDPAFPVPGEVIVGEVRKGKAVFTGAPVSRLLGEVRPKLSRWGGSDCAGPVFGQTERLSSVVV